MGSWSDKIVSEALIKGRARSFMSDTLVQQFITDTVSTERTTSAKAEAQSRIFGSKAGRMADFVGRVSGGETGLLNAMASNTDTGPIIDDVIALCFLYNLFLEKRSMVDSVLSDFADRLEMQIERKVLHLERTGPRALLLTESAGGSPTSAGGSMAKIYG